MYSIKTDLLSVVNMLTPWYIPSASECVNFLYSYGGLHVTHASDPVGVYLSMTSTYLRISPNINTSNQYLHIKLLMQYGVLMPVAYTTGVPANSTVLSIRPRNP